MTLFTHPTRQVGSLPLAKNVKNSSSIYMYMYIVHVYVCMCIVF